jgi:hypothetical protein
MALTRKTLFKENLEKYQTFVTDTNPNSTYFKISELPDVFTGGKNAFLIQGSEYLVPDTLIKIEIKDALGNVIYHEPGEGIVSSSVGGESIVTEYYEGVSKVIAVHIYPNKTTDINGNTEDGTAYGLATITILGEVSSYIDDNGLVLPIPTEWEGQYNVKWQRQVNVNPSLANTTKIRFYKRPIANITETLSPIYTIVDGVKEQSNIVSSFANIKLSQIDTFAGDVKRIKVFRTSLGDISDADLIQDILVESKELLTSYELSGSVVGNGGLFTSETLEKLWIPTGVTTQLTSSRIDNGVKLDGGGYFKYSSSLNLSNGNIFELGIDAFYSASTASNLGIYVSGSNNGEYLVGTLNGITPTKNLKDQTIAFTLPLAEPTASLYLSQSQGEWHVGNISLKLSQDTAFSPSEVEFVTSMPTVVGNETYKFNFEFYDVNNNFVPVAVTQSALFTGGNNNIGGTLIFISASASASAAELAAVSSSISGTMTVYSSSADNTIVTLSGSVSGSITTLSGSVSGSITSLSSSVSGSITTLSSSVSASITSLSSSMSQSVYQSLLTSFARVQRLADGNYSGSFIGDNIIYSPVLGGQLGYFSTLFKVGQSPNSIYLDARQTPRKIFIGGAVPSGDTEASGAYNNTNTPVYFDSTGKLSLGNKLSWNGVDTLTVNGIISASAGNFSGNITSTATISGGTISGGAISGGTIAIGSGNNIFKADSSGIYLGNTTFASAPFRVTPAGVLTATNANITGAITATSLTLSGFSLTKGDVGLGNVENLSAQNQAKTGIEAAITINSGGIAMGTGGYIRGGQSDYNTGTGFFLGRSGTTYKFSIGDGNTKGITWDGNTLTIGGDAQIGVSSIATIASKANAALTSVSSQNVTDALGYTPPSSATVNSADKTAGSVGGWTIQSNLIKSNNNQTILYNTGIISLTDGSSEKILITKDSLSANNTSATYTIPFMSSAGPATTNINASYQWNGGYTQTSDTNQSSNFTVTGTVVVVNIPYTGTDGANAGTNLWGSFVAGTTFNRVDYITSQTLSVSIHTTDGTLLQTKSVDVFYDKLATSNSSTATSTYFHPPIPSGVSAVSFSGLSSGAAYYVRVTVIRKTTTALILFGPSGTVSHTRSIVGNPAVASQTIDITTAAEKLSIGVNGLIASSAGGFAQIGPVASVGGINYSGAFLGNVKINGQLQVGSVQTSSDRRLKVNIRDIESPLIKIENLIPKKFTWNNIDMPLTDIGDAYGFIAQEVQETLPELVKNVGNTAVFDNLLSLDYQSLIAINTAAIKELLNKIEELEERIFELENK